MISLRREGEHPDSAPAGCQMEGEERKHEWFPCRLISRCVGSAGMISLHTFCLHSGPARSRVKSSRQATDSLRSQAPACLVPCGGQLPNAVLPATATAQ